MNRNNKVQEIAESYIEELKVPQDINIEKFKTKEEYVQWASSMIEEFTRLKTKFESIEEKNIYRLKDIEEELKQGKADELFEVGDELNFELFTGEPITVVCIGKNHDTMVNGKDKAKLTFAITKIDGEFEINEECSNKGGWKESKMRNVYLMRIFKLLPKTIQELIVPVLKDANNGDDEIEYVGDMLFLLSVREFKGTDEHSIAGEGEQYEYFKKGNNLKAKCWWTRSPNPLNNISWNFVDSYGYTNYGIVSNPNSVCPCFCIN